ncbi:MAG TPA: response regulator [Reyranella sp.]|nr:response regulator [Reyranella sp.]
MSDRPTDPPLEACDVLVVDDDFALSEAITQFLSRSGLRVRKAHNAAAALSFAAFAPPRVAILDYQLPDATGLALAAELHAENPSLHIILMSANNVDIDRKTLDAAGIKVFVNKPMPPGPLRQAVMRLLQS